MLGQSRVQDLYRSQFGRANALRPGDPVLVESEERQRLAEDRIQLHTAVDRFRQKVERARQESAELKGQAGDAMMEAVESKTKLLRIAKKMSVAARMRASAQVSAQREEADSLANAGVLCAAVAAAAAAAVAAAAAAAAVRVVKVVVLGVARTLMVLQYCCSGGSLVSVALCLVGAATLC
jgi:membrane protein involved in colicin uptake